MSEQKRQRLQAAEDFMKSMEQLQSLLQGDEAESARVSRLEPLPEPDSDWDTASVEHEGPANRSLRPGDEN
ncbi:hypothetical protein IQ241_12245 [Romeria aff. gracilis LEGE 07310]|uniref:Uncharacterized protein n=1 Tax=Vasconcelosia minhoensis LEGE 07310 TaxID=915328 RepID=A0A8J7AP79_9CYAN|nr:hypothetical protein [Romeria gracilis]MBE9078054.1 hypothetical protein [Romeria aff. gracilis LEGE 07310]